MRDGIQELQQLLDLAKGQGLRLRSIETEFFTIQLAEPWPPADRPAPPSPEEDDKAKLRRASKMHFGRVLPDEELAQMHKDGLL